MSDIARFYLAGVRRYGKVQEDSIPWYARQALEQLCEEEILQKSDVGGFFFMRCK